MIPELVGWAVPIAALAGVLAMVALIVVRGRRVRARRRRQRRVLDELDELGATSVHVTKPVPGQGDPEDLGPAHLARRKDSLVRRRSQFLIAPERVRGWPAPAGQTVLVRFELRGVRHELRCRLEGRSRLTKLGQRRLNLKTGVLFRLAPAGVIVRRERRDMMRFYVGEDGTSLPRGVTDARRFVDMQAWLWTTDLDSAVARTRLSAGDFLVLPPASSRSSDHVSTPEWGPPGETGLAVEVLDFSGGGLQIEGALTALADLLPASNDDGEVELLGRLADHVLQIAVAVKLTFPPSVEDLEPRVSPWIWLLSEVSRIWVVESDEGSSRARLGLALLYQVLEEDEVTGRPRRWSLIPTDGEADDLVAIHSALNQAAAQMDSVRPE